jgi:ribonuclease D
MAQANIVLIEKDLDEKTLNHYLNKKILAVDCEMMGLNITRDRLCLVQIGDENQRITLVKIVQGQIEAPNLKKLMEAKEIVKLFHFARTDLAFLSYYLDINVDNVFCTKVGSKIARTYTDKHSLKELTKELIGRDLKKDQQTSDWGSDKYSAEQIKYAANDVVHLIEIYQILQEMLEREGKFELAQKASSFIPTFARLDILGYKDTFEHK